MAAHHDQENLFAHQGGASKQQLQAKTPAARFPKTPLKVPLNDENVNHGFGGKSVLRTKGNNENVATVGKGGNGIARSGKAVLMTPAGRCSLCPSGFFQMLPAIDNWRFPEPRTARAPLGNKTTNAKARGAEQTPGVKQLTRDFEKTNIKPTSSRRPKQAGPRAESSKLEVHADKDPLDKEEEIEYAPPKPKDIPYESDICPDGVMTFEGLKPENLFRGFYQYYFNHVDDEGKTSLEREMEEQQQRSFERGEEQIRRDMEEFDWSIGDVPESKDLFKKKIDVATATTAAAAKKATRPVPKLPSTIAARKAASALAVTTTSSGAAQAKTTRTIAPATAKAPSRGFLLPKRKPTQSASQLSIPAGSKVGAMAASRSTLGYSKGRSASSAIQGGRDSANRQAEVSKTRTLSRSASTASSGSDVTITPARFAQSSKEWKKPDFLSIFDVDEDDGNLGGGMPQFDDFDDDFQLSTEF